MSNYDMQQGAAVMANLNNILTNAYERCMTYEQLRNSLNNDKERVALDRMVAYIREASELINDLQGFGGFGARIAMAKINTRRG